MYNYHKCIIINVIWCTVNIIPCIVHRVSSKWKLSQKMLNFAKTFAKFSQYWFYFTKLFLWNVFLILLETLTVNLNFLDFEVLLSIFEHIFEHIFENIFEHIFEHIVEHIFIWTYIWTPWKVKRYHLLKISCK